MSTSAAMLHDARVASGLTVRGIAEMAGVSPSTVSRIEAGTLDPTFGTLSRLLAEAGCALTSQTLPRSAPRRGGMRLADLNRAWLTTGDGGEPDWTAVRALLDHLDRHPEQISTALVDAPRRPSSAVLRALLAGLAEELADKVCQDPPGWATRTPALPEEWSPAGTPRMKERWRTSTPRALRDRNLVVDAASLWHATGPRA